jgi:hypothetical protein
MFSTMIASMFIEFRLRTQPTLSIYADHWADFIGMHGTNGCERHNRFL